MKPLSLAASLAVLFLIAPPTIDAQSIPLAATIHFDQPQGTVNRQLISTVQDSPLAAVNSYLEDTVAPPFMRMDMWLQASGPCPDGSNPGPLYNSTNNTFNYCQMDQRLSDALAAGSLPLLIVDYMPAALADPTCAATDGHGLGATSCPPSDYGKFHDLVEASMIHAYQNFAVVDFEVWNEPDWTFFAGTLADYLKIYETSNQALLDAESTLGLAAGTFHLGGPAVLFNDPVWIDGLMNDAVSKPALRVDFISWHLYANDPLAGPLFNPDGLGVGVPPYAPWPFLYAGTYFDSTQQAMQEIAPFLAQRTDLHPKLWIDEWNVNAGWDPRMDNSYETAFLAASMHAMQDAGLDRAARFNTWDGSPSSSAGVGNWGLFTNDAQVRPAIYELQMWRRMAPITATVTPADPASQARDASSSTRYEQNLVASSDAEERRETIIIYNFVPYSPLYSAPPYCGGGPDLSATLTLAGLSDGTYRVVQQQVDCTTPIQPMDSASPATSLSSLSVTGGQGTVQVTVPADGVVMLTIKPGGGDS